MLDYNLLKIRSFIIKHFSITKFFFSSEYEGKKGKSFVCLVRERVKFQ